MKKLLAALLVALSTVSAGAQPVNQSGSVTPGHASRWITNGVTGDGGSAASPVITSLGTLGSGPTICAQSAATSTGNYNRLCLGVTSSRGTIEIDNFGTATGGLVFAVNGVAQGLPTINLPVTAGDAVCFLNSGGVLTDCGAAAILSVFGRTGHVTAQTGDYTVGQVTGAAPLASPTFTGTVNNSGTGYTVSNATGPIVSNASGASGPTFIPNKAFATSGIGGASGGVSLVSNGSTLLNCVSSSGSCTTATPAWHVGNQQLANTIYADLVAGVVCTDSGSSVASYTLQLACPNITEPFNDNQVIVFQSPILGAVLFKLAGGSGASYQIWDPGMTGLLVAEATSQSFDIKQGGRYALRWSTSAGVWQLITPPKTYTEATPPVTFTYFQNGNTATSVAGIFNFEVFNASKGWITQYGELIQELFNGTAYVDGIASQSLTVGKGYHVYGICINTCASLADAKLDFVSRYFDGATASAGYSGVIAGTALSVDGGAPITGTIQVGQEVDCGTCRPGTYIVSGSGTTWVVNLSQTVSYTTFTGAPAKYFNQNAAPGRPMFIDGQGNYGQYLGMVFARSNTDITSYFTRSQALAASTKPGNTTSSSPFSVYPRQPLTSVSSAGSSAQPIAGNVPGSLAELSTSLETYWTGHEWEPFNDVRTLGSYDCSAQGVTVRLQVIATALTGAGGDTILFDETRTCTGVGSMPWDETVSWPFSDAFVLFKMKGSVAGGTATFSFQPQSRMSY